MDITKPMKDLFKPYEIEYISISELLKSNGLSKMECLELLLQNECSKSKDGTCINNDCPHNLVEYRANGGVGDD